MAKSGNENWATLPAKTVTVQFDPDNADLSTTLEAPESGATVRWVKEELCEQVPFGTLEPEMFHLCAAAAPLVALDDDTLVTEALAALILQHEEDEGEDLEESDEEAGEGEVGEWLGGSRREEPLQREGAAEADAEALAARRAREEARRRAAEESAERIARAGQDWSCILGVGASASLEEVKRAFRRLALLHHPDKNVGSSEDATFKRVQWAYEEGLQHCNSQRPQQQRQHQHQHQPDQSSSSFSQRPRRFNTRAGAKAQGAKPRQPRTAWPPPPPTSQAEDDAPERKRSLKWVVGANPTKAELREAMSSWEYSEDVLEKAVPSDIQNVTVEEFADWLRKAACLPMDIREKGESYGPELGTSVCYSDLYFSPEKVAAQLSRMFRDGRPVVVFSQRGGRKGNCGLAGCILLDIFGFDEKQVFRLDGGFTRWRWWVDNHSQHQDADLVGDWFYGSKPTKYSVSRIENGLLRFDGPSSKFGTVHGVLQLKDGRFLAVLTSASGLDAGAIRLSFDKATGALVSNFKSPTMADWGSDIVARRQGAKPGGTAASPG